MNYYDICKQFQKFNLSKSDYGNIFINDQTDLDEESIKTFFSKQVDMINHFDKYTNFYFPFDISSVINVVTANDGTMVKQMVTFIDNAEHKLSSPIDFVFRMANSFEFHGYILIVPFEDMAETCQTIQKEYPEEFVLEQGTRFLDNSEYKYGMICHIKKFIVKFANTGKVITNDPILRDLKCFEDVNGTLSKKHVDNFEILLDRTYTTIWLNLSYFMKLVIDPSLFVVEERVASSKKGSIKLKSNSSPLFHVIDIKTLRTKYIKRESDGDFGNKKAPHERRRHTRTFRSDFYKNKKGETIIIEPTWIGPTESFNPDKNRLYKVRLDIG